MVGYGAYGLPVETGFDIANLGAVEKDWVIALAHVRGGNEKGVNWHRQGKGMKKANSFKDFIAVAQYLVADGITHPHYLAAKGSSAGGTLIAALANTHPHLFRAMILSHPFLDVLTTLQDTSLPLTLTDHKEFGNPLASMEEYDLISSYCPYENITPKEYPSMFLTVSLQDPRVPLFGSLKYIEKIR